VVNEQQTKEAIQELIIYTCGLPWFERKREVVAALYDVAWRLHDKISSF
jgi:hypothetical protein